MTSASATTITELPPFRSFIRLESIDPAHNRYRFFVLHWQPGLWHDRVRVRVWGRVGTAGRTRGRVPSAVSDGDRLVQQLLRRRLQRGYVVTAWR